MKGELQVQEEEIWMKILNPLHPLNNIEINNHFKYEPRIIHKIFEFLCELQEKFNFSFSRIFCLS